MRHRRCAADRPDIPRALRELHPAFRIRAAGRRQLRVFYRVDEAAELAGTAGRKCSCWTMPCIPTAPSRPHATAPCTACGQRSRKRRSNRAVSWKARWWFATRTSNTGWTTAWCFLIAWMTRICACRFDQQVRRQAVVCTGHRRPHRAAAPWRGRALSPPVDRTAQLNVALDRRRELSENARLFQAAKRSDGRSATAPSVRQAAAAHA